MGFCCLGITEKSYTANRSCLTSKEQNATAVKRSSQKEQSKPESRFQSQKQTDGHLDAAA